MDISDGFVLFQEFEKEIKNNNRFFPDSKYLRLFEEITKSEDHYTVVETGTPLYRARREKSGTSYTKVSDLGINKSNPSNNRASPIGIPYMYLADEPDTALAEIRANVNDRAIVATYTASKDLKFFALREHSTYSGFSGAEFDSNVISGFVLFLSLAFSRPIQVQAELEYLPCQYFAEFCKTKGFSGIQYISSARGFHGYPKGNHYNYVLFDDSDVVYKEAFRYMVQDITYKTHQECPVMLKDEGEK